MAGPGNPAYDQIIRDAMGLNKPMMSDAQENEIYLGDEPERPVFSDKETKQQALWNNYQNALSLYKADPSPARIRTNNAAVDQYETSLDDPKLPQNAMAKRWAGYDKQGTSDADIILKAMAAQQLAGRK